MGKEFRIFLPVINGTASNADAYSELMGHLLTYLTNRPHCPPFEPNRTDIYRLLTADIGMKIRDNELPEMKIRTTQNVDGIPGVESWDKYSLEALPPFAPEDKVAVTKRRYKTLCGAGQTCCEVCMLSVDFPQNNRSGIQTWISIAFEKKLKPFFNEVLRKHDLGFLRLTLRCVQEALNLSQTVPEAFPCVGGYPEWLLLLCGRLPKSHSTTIQWVEFMKQQYSWV